MGDVRTIAEPGTAQGRRLSKAQSTESSVFLSETLNLHRFRDDECTTVMRFREWGPV